MNKKLIMLTAVLASAMMFSSCGKSKKDDATAEPSQSQSDVNTNTQSGTGDSEDNSKNADEKKADNSADSSSQGNKAQNGSDADSGVGMSSDEFADLVDKFNNTQDEQEKEAAREKIQAILEKAEQQQ